MKITTRASPAEHIKAPLQFIFCRLYQTYRPALPVSLPHTPSPPPHTHTHNTTDSSQNSLSPTLTPKIAPPPPTRPNFFLPTHTTTKSLSWAIFNLSSHNLPGPRASSPRSLPPRSVVLPLRRFWGFPDKEKVGTIFRREYLALLPLLFLCIFPAPYLKPGIVKGL